MFIVVFLSILCVLGAAHWYLWRRLVRDVSAPRGVWRRTGTVLIFVLPALMIAAQVGGRTGLPFGLKQAVAWPGLMWFAVVVYLLLTTVAFDAVRPLLRRVLEARAAKRDSEATPAAPRTGADQRTAERAEPRAEDPEVGAASALPDEVSQRTDGETGGTTTAVAPAPVSAAGPGTHESGSHESGARGSHPDSSKPAKGGSGTRAGEDPQDASRRLFLARAGAITAGVVTAATVGSGTYSVLAAGPKVKRVQVSLDKLPPAADGYLITLISDIHLSPVVGRSVCQRIVDRANATNPDMIALAGDLVDGSVADLRSAAQPLAQLRAREGVFFATGNHEYFSGAQEWKTHLATQLGIKVLDNERVELRHFDLAGVSDLAGEAYDDGPDYVKALGGRDQDRAAVLIAHQPAMVEDAKQHGVDLQLAGHTHGGQMWPGNFLAALANPTLFGLERYDDTQLYVTRGAGAWGPPVRVGAEPDITVLELRSGASGS